VPRRCRATLRSTSTSRSNWPKAAQTLLAEIEQQLEAQNAQMKQLAEEARALAARGVVIPAVALEPLRRVLDKGGPTPQDLSIRLTAAQLAARSSS
jgi:hypothetical protein